jgi:hypothetical protein
MNFSLLNGEFRPTTDSSGFLEAPCDLVMKTMKQWHAELRFREEIIEIRGAVGDALQALYPLETQQSREVIVPTQNGWTAYWSSNWRGTDCSGFLGYLHKRIGCRGLEVCHAPQNLRRESVCSKGTWGATMLAILCPEAKSQLGYERVIAAANDGGKWIFEAFGEPLDFEDVSRYTARRVRDRFTPETLVNYLKHFNVYPFDDNFYMPDPQQPAYLFQNLRLSRPGNRTYTCDEIQKTL